MEVNYQLIKIGRIGKVFMIINAMVHKLTAELMEDLVFAAINQYVFYV